MRADVNVSVRRPGEPFGTRTETKNVNSVRFVMAVVESEARRQIDVIESGGTVVQETRLYDPDKNETRSMRSKEDAHDYRYFPDPDLLPLELDDAFLEECRASLPELPDAKRHRYENALGLSPYNANVLTADVQTAREFEALLASVSKAAGKGEDAVAKRVANWLLSEQPGVLNAAGVSANHARNTIEANTAIVVATENGTISGSKAKEIFEAYLTTEIDLAAEIAANQQTSDTGAIEAAVDAVLAANADKVAEYKGGKEALFGFFVGQTMKAMQGKGNPQLVNQVLKAKLG
jgi:aspartyl-tRNA(Asn)/glutamyl-tRNA(Gln) amidotransferase subunit B